MTGGPDTMMGGDQRDFPTTIWSSIFQMKNRSTPEFQDKLQRLLGRYWKPIYRTIRITWGRSNEDAKDLAQSFFTMILEDDFFARFCPEKGRFRSFIKAALAHFMVDAEKARQRIKRGGGRVIFSLDAANEDMPLEPEDRTGTPEEILDREWAEVLLDESIDELKKKLKAEGHEVWYKVYEAIDLAPHDEGKVTYRDAAKKLGISETDVTHYLHAARRRLRTILLQRVQEYALSDDEADDELRQILSG